LICYFSTNIIPECFRRFLTPSSNFLEQRLEIKFTPYPVGYQANYLGVTCREENGRNHDRKVFAIVGLF
jgi:hypothetical protein